MMAALPHLQRRYDPAYARNRRAVMDAVVDAAAEAYDLTRKRVLSSNRELTVAIARNIAMFLLREFGFSLHEIGDYFDRHHTTIVSAHQRTSERIERDETFHGVVSLIAGRAGLA